MDKVVFLESLSFLTKQETDPPPKNENVLLESIQLSIEIDKHGPVLLKNAADPAMFPCKISFFQSDLGSPSSESTSFSFSQGETPRTGESDSKQQNKPIMQLLLQLLEDDSDGSNVIYRVDASQLQQVKLIKSSSSKEFPASIVMLFQGDCNLRLFSLTPTDKLAAVYNFLDTKLSRHAAPPPQVKGDGGDDDDLESATCQCLKTLQQGWNETEQLLSNFGASRRVEEELSQRLNKAASSLSYVPSSQRDHFELVQNERLEQTQEQVEDLLTAYFPRANKKRRRLNNNSEDSASAKSSTDHLAPIDREECLESAQKLLQQTRRLMQQRHEVAFLPIRG